MAKKKRKARTWTTYAAGDKYGRPARWSIREDKDCAATFLDYYDEAACRLLRIVVTDITPKNRRPR